jgi:hypothetical protein
MTTTYYSIITNNGLIKNAQAAANNVNLDLNQIAVGDSNGVDYDPLPENTALQNELFRTNLTHVVVDENNPNQLIIEGVIDEEIGPFFVREIGIFDSDGDLFALGKFPETFKSNLPSGVGKKLYIRMILGFANTPNITLVASDVNNDPNFSSHVNDELNDRLKISENLGDLDNVETARNNLGVYSEAEVDNQVDSKVFNKNYVINGNFDIWQRGASFDQSNSFGPDRWRIWNSGATVSFTRQEFTLGQTEVPGEPRYYINIDCTVADDSVGLLQYIEDVRTLVNKTVTISFWAKADSARTLMTRLDQRFGSGGSAEELGTDIINHNLTTSWQKFTHTLSIPSIAGKTIGDGSFLKLVMVNPNNETSSIDVAQVQLEEGNIATNFKHRHIKDELALCQRYFCKTFPDEVAPASNAGNPGVLEFSASGTGSGVNYGIMSRWQFPVTMRAAPSISRYTPRASNSSGNAMDIVNSGVTTQISVTISSIANNAAVFRLHGGGSVSNLGNAYGVHAVADAEL